MQPAGERRRGRRTFLKKCAAGAAGALALARLSPRALGANEAIQVGCMGTGGRCRRLMQRLARIPGVRLTAVCDVWDEHLGLARELADPKALSTKDYHQVLARRDVDAVVIGSPDHWHVPMTVDACEAGKHVYVEKPLTHKLDEGPKVIEAVRRTRRVVQVGTQQRSMPQFRKGYELVRSGLLGKVHKVHLTWNRNAEQWGHARAGIDPAAVDWKRFLGGAPPQPFDEYRFRNWRWFWDFGGGIFTDLMVHFIDVACWFLDLDVPEAATALGDHFLADHPWETPDTVQALFRFPQRDVQIYFEGTFINARHQAMIELLGRKATMYLDRGRYEILPERRSDVEPSEWVIGSGPKGASFYTENDGPMYHLQDWVDSMRNGKEPNAPVEAGAKSAALAHWANQALRLGRVVRPGA